MRKALLLLLGVIISLPLLAQDFENERKNDVADSITYKKNVVVETFTFCRCGYDPRAIVACDIWKQLHGSSVIPIFIHHGDDPMALSYDLYGEYLGLYSFPTGRFNRNHDVTTNYVSTAEILPYLEGETTAKTSFKNVYYDPTSRLIEITYLARMGYTNSNKSLSIAAVVLEDNVNGMTRDYWQKNYFSSTNVLTGYFGEEWKHICQKFEYESDDVVINHNHVARGIYPAFKGQKVADSWICDTDVEGTLKFAMPDNVLNEEETSIVLILTDDETGEIVAAEQIGYNAFQKRGVVNFIFNGDKNEFDITPGQSNCLSLSINDAERVSGFQTDITLPDGLLIAGNSDDLEISFGKGTATDSHKLAASAISGENRYRIIAYSDKKEAFANGDNLLNINIVTDENFEPGENIIIDNTIIYLANDMYYSPEEVQINVTANGILTGVDAVNSTNGNCDIYNTLGICIKRNATEQDIINLPCGLYIIGGKKVFIR